MATKQDKKIDRQYEILKAQMAWEDETAEQQGDVDLHRLVRCVREIYAAGLWKCDSLPEAAQVRLWTQLRDAAGIKEGFARARGVAANAASNDAQLRGTYRTSEGC
jgi:hypothetical protein